MLRTFMFINEHIVSFIDRMFMLGQVCLETVKELEHLGHLCKDGRLIQNGARKSSPV